MENCAFVKSFFKKITILTLCLHKSCCCYSGKKYIRKVTCKEAFMNHVENKIKIKLKWLQSNYKLILKSVS